MKAPNVAKLQQGSTLVEIVTNVTTNMQKSTNNGQKSSLPKKWMEKGRVSPIVSSECEDTELAELEIKEEERYKQEQYLKLEKENQMQNQSVLVTNKTNASKGVGTKQKQTALVTNKTNSSKSVGTKQQSALVTTKNSVQEKQNQSALVTNKTNASKSVNTKQLASKTKVKSQLSVMKENTRKTWYDPNKFNTSRIKHPKKVKKRIT